MVAVIPPPPALNGELTLFHTTDPLLQNSPVVVFYGPAASVGAPSSRIQVHIFTPAGLESYPRLAISPNSPYYAAVNALPREEQADEVCRGLAFGLSKYFADIPKLVKETWTTQVLSSKKAASAFGLFGDAHIAVLASRMTRIESAEHIIEDIQRALGEQCTSWLDLDIVLPPGSIQQTAASDSNTEDDVTEDELLERRYKQHAPLIKHFGEPAFIPTSKMKRAPSRVTAIGRSRILMRNQKEVVRKEMCELVDTEESYVGKVAQLVHQVALELRQSVERDAAIPVATPSERAVNELFPQCLEDILELNSNFLTAVKAILDQTEEAAIKDLQSDGGSADSTGVLQFSKCLHEWLPKFAKSYAEYMQAHSRASILLKQLKTSADSTVAEKIREIGEKRLSSLLIEPVQRLPRYTLYIDTIARQLPVAHPALKSLLKARDIVSEICSQDASGAEQANILDRLKRLVQSWPAQLQSLGRLVSVVDMAELDPPYEPTEFRGPSGILLLFSDCLVAVEKCSANSLSARALIAELDKSVSVDTGRPRTPDLRFTDAFRLDEVLAAEFMDNLVVSILPKSSEKTTPEPVYDRVYLLEGVYAGKASRFLEEMTKAKVEGRFTEALRESGAWEVRSIQPAVGELNLFSSIFERSKEQPKGAGNGPAPIQVVIEPTRHTTGIRLGERGVDTIVSIKDAGSGQWHLSVDSSIVAGTRDKVGQDDFIPVLLKRCE
ncbi:hypothetical protein M8818_000901 [Zalaria obscura]|uniref:Uncharacterized protein n=1 Tax=Zalaria obscura TaxID=2024903 RepID=A0ACC3SL29_9PEZI